jgi:Mechanosensitive ion channel MscS, C-terminal
MHYRIFFHLFGDVAHDFGQRVMLWHAGLLLGTLVLAWGLAWLLRRTLDLRRQTRYQALRFGAESLNCAFFPLIGAALVWIAQAAAGVPRVLQAPAPTPYPVGFGPDGINLEPAFWIEDATTGTGGVRSAINRNIWRLFSANGISIPFAQREVRIVGAGDILSRSANLTEKTADEPGSGA